MVVVVATGNSAMAAVAVAAVAVREAEPAAAGIPSSW